MEKLCKNIIEKKVKAARDFRNDLQLNIAVAFREASQVLESDISVLRV